MAWIEAHQNLERHPKTFALRMQMGWNLNETIGFLMRLWWWALDAAKENGRVDVLTSPGFIEDAFGIRVPGPKLLEALIASGFVDKHDDGALTIHDFDQYSGRLIASRHKNAIRQREYRAKSRNALCSTSRDALRNDAHNTTQHNTTITATAREIAGEFELTSDPPKRRKQQPKSEWIDQIYEAYPRKDKPLEAKKSIAKCFRLKAIKEFFGEDNPKELFECILAKVQLYACHREKMIAKGKSIKNFTPQPAKWFDAGGLMEDPTDWDEMEK